NPPNSLEMISLKWMDSSGMKGCYSKQEKRGQAVIKESRKEAVGISLCRLDQELDFILSQQKELEDLLTPLEESVKEQSGTIYLQHADEERERTYKLAENIDAQLKRMAQDLKDITEHLNTSRGPADTSDPLQQICKILNAHMDSLQWIDQNSAVLQRKVEEVTKVCESRRKEQERSFRITFD
uniref:Nucleoporin NSP1-like C-terminal domain-containing protein n=1 Tax=Zonotrichia albicollis TaxID=44394 RepID=A0A8D2M5J5_ZONAL